MANYKILTIDDDTFLRASIVAYLEDFGFTALEAGNGRSGLEMFRQERPDLVLLDLRMPEMDGIEILPIMVKESPQTPIIIVSGMGTLDDSIQALRLGAWDYLTKPIQDFALLEHTMTRALDRAQLMRENQRYKEYLEEEVIQRTQQLERVNKALQTLSAGNEALVRATDEIQLLEHICKVIQGIGGYTVAWVGYLEGDTLHCKACSGKAGCNHESINLKNEDGGPTPECLLNRVRAGEVIVMGNVCKECVCVSYMRLLQQDDINSVFAYPLESNGEIFGILAIYSKERDAFGTEEARLLRELGADLTFGIRTLRLHKEREQAVQDRERSAHMLEAAMIQSIGAIGNILEKRDPYTAGHQQRVSLLTVAIAQELGLDDQFVEGLKLGSNIHDIGKVYIPAEILNRPGKLTPEEFGIIKTHAQVGFDIVKDVSFPWPVAQMILQHHERIDGSGYPNGLKGDEIILEAKIMAVADVIEAMSSHRPYRAGLGIDMALQEIERGCGTSYDEAIVEVTLRLFREKGFTLDEWQSAG